VQFTGRENKVHGGNNELIDKCDGGICRYRREIVNVYVARRIWDP
jgi:hypothetical protein